MRASGRGSQKNVAARRGAPVVLFPVRDDAVRRRRDPGQRRGEDGAREDRDDAGPRARAARPAARRPHLEACVEINQCVGCTRQFFTKSFLAMMLPCWPRPAVMNQHRHAIEQAARRWRGG